MHGQSSNEIDLDNETTSKFNENFKPGMSNDKLEEVETISLKSISNICVLKIYSQLPARGMLRMNKIQIATKEINHEYKSVNN